MTSAAVQRESAEVIAAVVATSDDANIAGRVWANVTNPRHDVLTTALAPVVQLAARIPNSKPAIKVKAPFNPAILGAQPMAVVQVQSLLAVHLSHRLFGLAGLHRGDGIPDALRGL